MAKKEKWYRIPGPLPAQPEMGRLTLGTADVAALRIQGRMINGVCTTAYLNLLTREYSHLLGVHRTCDNFVVALNESQKVNGSKEGFRLYRDVHQSGNTGEHTIDWENGRLILAQIFRGPVEGGHWSLLVVDRTLHLLGILVYFDSLPNFMESTLTDLQALLDDTPLVKLGSKWIRASMPKQGMRSNDCGIFMCCIAAAYIKGLLQADIFPPNWGRRYKGCSREQCAVWNEHWSGR